MILVDTSVWTDHLRASDEQMTQLLLAGQVLAHPFVIGELALGKLRNRDRVLGALQDMPQAVVATESEVLRLIGQKTLFGLGMGYIDSHLLAAVLLTPGSWLWTRDKRLLTAGAQLGIAANTPH
ncbi:MAG: type II toxin-antitoxin system VapC family toxin [Polaromonas sp.]